MSPTFTCYFGAQAHRDAADSGAYIRVRVPGAPRPNGSILVYLPDGTGLVVNSNQLLHLDAFPNCRGESDRTNVPQAQHQLPPKVPAQQIAEATSKPAFPDGPGPDGARKVAPELTAGWAEI